VRWLHQLGLGKWKEVLLSADMTLLGLTSVDDNELKEIGVDAIGARKTLLAAAATLEPKDLLGAPQRSGW